MENLKVDKEKLKKFNEILNLDKLILYTYIESTNAIDYIIYSKEELRNIDLIPVKEIPLYKGGYLGNYPTKKSMIKNEKVTKNTTILNIYELMDL